MSESCAVCFDGFNKSTRVATACPYCNIQICRGCLQTYLLNDISDYPRCINTECGHGWEREFLDGEFTRSFRLTTYKTHREKVLSDRERARLPASQEDAAAYKRAKEIRQVAAEEVKQLQSEMAKLQVKLSAAETRVWRTNAVIDSYGRRRFAEDGIQLIGEDVRRTERSAPAAFIRPCPAPDCKGFLSTAWKCGLCDQWTCPDCHELKGPDREIEHTCDPAVAASAALIDKESKACPKCGVRICKIEGCDQMWCTACNTAFNWRTGKIAEGPVHNPHYFAWLRSQGRDPNGAAGPAAGAGAGGCEQDLDRQITRILTGTANNNYYYGFRAARSVPARTITDEMWLAEAWRIIREIEDPYGRNTEINADEEFRKLRVKYMSNQLSEDDWKIALQRLEKDVNFQRAKQQVRELFLGAARDTMRQLLTPGHNKPDIKRQLEELITYCNNSYSEITKRFGRKTPTIEVKPR
jgi:hypothetical protein